LLITLYPFVFITRLSPLREITMKVAIIFKGGKQCVSGAPPDQKLMANVGKYLADLKSRGIALDGFGLKPPTQSTQLPNADQDQVVLDGPFAETKEVIGGIWVWQVNSIEDAWELLSKCPRPENLNPAEHGTVEIREIYEPEDYGQGFVEAIKSSVN
jgi:hypothetical protein